MNTQITAIPKLFIGMDMHKKSWSLHFCTDLFDYRGFFYACKICPLKNQCTKLPKRIIQRSEYQDAVDENDNNIKRNSHYYKRRQAICEHPFGTIKRHLGLYTHLAQRITEGEWEMNLIMFCYNFVRTKNILGIEKILQAIESGHRITIK